MGIWVFLGLGLWFGTFGDSSLTISIVHSASIKDLIVTQLLFSVQCPDVNFNTMNRQGEEWTNSVKRWNDCRILCQRRRDCKFWTWHHGNSGKWAYKCVTMNNAGGLIGSTDVVSGEANVSYNSCHDQG